MDWGRFFDQAPETAAGVPVAAMRAAARAPRVFPTAPAGRPSTANFAPPVQSPEMPMRMPETDSPPQGSEWGALGNTALGLAKEFGSEKDPKTDFNAFLKNFDTKMAAAGAERANLIAQLAGIKSQNDPNARKPRTLSPMEAPDTGTEIDMDGVPAEYLARNKAFESGNDPKIVNKVSGASGLFQFLPGTWRDLMKEAPQLGLTADGIFDEQQQHMAMKYYTAKSAGILKSILGRNPTGGELYAAHLLGHAGGPNVIKNIDAPITETIGKAARDANPWVNNYKTGRDFIAALNKQFGGG